MLQDLLVDQKGTMGGFAFSLGLPTGRIGLLQTEVGRKRQQDFGGKDGSLASGSLRLRGLLSKGGTRRRLQVRSSLGVWARDIPASTAGSPELADAQVPEWV